MTPAHGLMVLQAETERLFRRPVAIAGLILSALFGVLGPAVVLGMNTLVIESARAYVEAQPETQGIDLVQGPEYFGWGWAVYIAYYGRNFLFLPILIFLLGGLSMASEFVARTTREDVLRPFPRWGLLLAKWCALVIWILAAMLLTGGISALLGLAVSGGLPAAEATALVPEAPEWSDFGGWWVYLLGSAAGPLQQILTTLVTDVGFATLALAVAVITRSVAATVAGLVMVFALQVATSIGFGLVTNDITRSVVAQQAPWLDEATRTSIFAWIDAIALWQPPFVIGSCSFTGPSWQGFLTLLIVTLVGLGIGLARFETMDVP